jgi:hypothetical protein
MNRSLQSTQLNGLGNKVVTEIWHPRLDQLQGPISVLMCFTLLETESQVSQVKTAMPATAGSPCCRFSRGLFSFQILQCRDSTRPWLISLDHGQTVDLLVFQLIYPLVNIKNYGKSPFLMENSL